MKAGALFMLAAVMSGTLVVMLYLPLVMIAVLIVCGSLGVFLPYHAPPPSNPDPPMP